MPRSATSTSGRLLAVLCIGTLLAVSCGPPERWAGDYSKYPLVDPKLDPQVAQVLMQEWSVASSEVFLLGMDRIEEKTGDPALAGNLTRFTLAFNEGVRRTGWRLEPVAAAYDSWLYLQQVDRFLHGEDARAAFGPLLSDVQSEVGKVQGLLDLVLEEMLLDVDAAYEDSIAEWIDEHPLEGLELARVAPMIEIAVATDQVRDAWQAVARAEFTSTAAYARLNEALLTIPEDLRRQIEAAIRGIMREPLVVNALVGLSRLGDGMKELAAAVDSLDRGVDGHRDAILEEIDRERIHTLEVLQSEREIVLSAIADERNAIVEAIGVEREAISGALESQVALVLEDTRRIGLDTVDRAAGRLRGVVLSASVVIAIGLVAGLIALGLLLRARPPRD